MNVGFLRAPVARRLVFTRMKHDHEDNITEFDLSPVFKYPGETGYRHSLIRLSWMNECALLPL